MKINLLLAIAFISFITYANIDYLHGIVGMTLRDGGTGCVCHNLDPTSSVTVWIEGPDSLIMSQTAQYKLLMTGGPAVEGGFNVASFLGEVNPIDTLISLLSGELTHSSPNPFMNDTVYWIFSYTAPDSLTTDTLYSVGNSVNGNGNPSQDQWNFGENFVIHIIDNPVYVQNENLFPEEFVLYQNYPNPFNPLTKIKFTIPSNVEWRNVSNIKSF
ncbi:MAG: choice-of-anchor V domain-containing protein [Ignavibacteriaceae bacterium]|nr:choice-of-anchor V domain-containing protein [Ignavibacteriaceae bacterium]